eukprot:766715-Hanusia_phi.AAC.1
MLMLSATSLRTRTSRCRRSPSVLQTITRTCFDVRRDPVPKQAQDTETSTQKIKRLGVSRSSEEGASRFQVSLWLGQAAYQYECMAKGMISGTMTIKVYKVKEEKVDKEKARKEMRRKGGYEGEQEGKRGMG